MEALSKAAILQANDLQSVAVDVPEWGGSVFVRGMTAAERDQYEQELMSISRTGKTMELKYSLSNVKARLAVKCIVDSDGTRLFTDSDVQAVGNKSASALNRIVDVVMALSGLTDADVEELEKNSESVTAEDSLSV